MKIFQIQLEGLLMLCIYFRRQYERANGHVSTWSSRVTAIACLDFELSWHRMESGNGRGGSERGGEGEKWGCIASNSNCYLNCFIFSGEIYHFSASSDSKDGRAVMRTTRSEGGFGKFAFIRLQMPSSEDNPILGRFPKDVYALLHPLPCDKWKLWWGGWKNIIKLKLIKWKIYKASNRGICNRKWTKKKWENAKKNVYYPGMANENFNFSFQQKYL